MKYVSPQTEKRKQQKKKRKKQLLVCVCFVAVIIGLVIAVVAFTGRDKPAQNSSQTNSESVETSSENIQEGNSTEITESEVVTESESISEESQNSGEQQTESSPQAEATPKPSQKKNKKSFDLFGKIKSLFVKEEIIEVVFPAMSFGVQVQEAADSIQPIR